MNKRLSIRAGAIAGLLALGTVAGSAVAQSEPGSTPVNPELRVLAPESEAGSVGSDTQTASGTASVWVPISPFRAVDSRSFTNGRLTSVHSNGRAVAVPVLGNVDNPAIIPANATGITFNVTAVRQSGSGYITVADVTQTVASAAETSTLNWGGPGTATANGSSVAVNAFEGDAGFVMVLVGGPGASSDFIIDVTGYYVPAPTATP